MREFDGVDFAILMAFASEPLANRQHEPTQQTYRHKLRTQTAQIIYAEYRTWIVDGRVVTASQYKQGSRVVYDSNVPNAITAFAQECVDLWAPAPAFVLDVAVTYDEISEQYGHEPHGFKIVETNTLNAAGWYRGNVGKIVDALERLEGTP